MKKNIIIQAFLTAIISIIFLSCEKEEPKAISIDLDTAKAKIGYFSGESLDLTGLIVVINMDDGSDKQISFLEFADNEIICDHENGQVVSIGMNSINITHNVSQKTATLNISVVKEIDDETLVIDRDGNIYSTVTISDQVWMSDNLRTTKDNEGIPIKLVNNDSDWHELEVSAYCWYGNDQTLCKENNYGAFYNYHVVESQKVCPSGWHVASKEEFWKLWEYLEQNEYYNGIGSRTISKALSSTYGWHISTVDGSVGYNQLSNNFTGFSALPAGERKTDGKFKNEGLSAHFWLYNDYPTSFEIIYDSPSFNVYSTIHRHGHSIRCVKD